jgi:hypothetical protein
MSASPDRNPTGDGMLTAFDARWEWLQQHGSPEEVAAYQEFMVKRLCEATMQGFIDENQLFERWGKLSQKQKSASTREHSGAINHPVEAEADKKYRALQTLGG